MKRSAPLRRKAPLRSRACVRPDAMRRATNPARDEFKRVRTGRCAVCGLLGLVRRHHVIYEQHVRRAGGDCWDIANSLWIGVETFCNCHRHHHDAVQRIPADLIPDAALAFAVDLFGSDERAADYFARYYAPARTHA